MRLDRLLAITVMLLNRERISARELADKFEVTVRTIYRDVDALNMAGIPIISYPGNNGGFGIMENYKLDHQLLTLSDMTAILSALRGMNVTLEDRELDNAIEKITSLVPHDRKDEVKRSLEQVVIDILPWGYGDKQKHKLQHIHSALADSKMLHFSYRSAKGELLQRAVEPMTLILKGYSWYLFAYCSLRNDFRLFRISRMKNVEILQETFTRRDTSYRDILTNDEKQPDMIDMVLRFDPAVQVHVEDYYGEEDITIDDDGYLLVRVSFPDDRWIIAHILSFADAVEVIEPARIRDIVKETAEKITRLY